jgi:hypothetical protein
MGGVWGVERFRIEGLGSKTASQSRSYSNGVIWGNVGITGTLIR